MKKVEDIRDLLCDDEPDELDKMAGFEVKVRLYSDSTESDEPEELQIISFGLSYITEEFVINVQRI